MKVFKGHVISAKLPKTATVLVERYFVHPVYQKRIRRTDKYLCHDELGVKEGEAVTIQECRPMSVRKHFVITARTSQTMEVEKTAKVEKQAETTKPKRTTKKK